ncbi:MAG: ACT domain-containing protein [Candidatus Micrarchaeota archaeon]
MKSVTIVADDKVGLLADISYVLAKSKINIEAINVDVISAKAVITIGLNDVARGKQVIEAAGYKVEDPEAIVIKISEKPGELKKFTDNLTKEGVGVKTSTVLTKDNVHLIVALTVDKHKRAVAILKDYLITNESEY